MQEKKISSVKYLPEPVEDIPNDPLSQITTEDIYIDDSLTDILNQEKNKLYFPQPSTDNRKDFEINIPDYEMIVFSDYEIAIFIFYNNSKKRIKNSIK